MFSSDSQHFAYTAGIGAKQVASSLSGGKNLVVVDGAEGKRYDGIIVGDTGCFGGGVAGMMRAKQSAGEALCEFRRWYSGFP